MFEWPRFAGYLSGTATSPAERLLSFLEDVGAAQPVPKANEVLSQLFDDAELVDGIAVLAPQLHHIGLIAPPRLSVSAVTQVVARSPFRSRVGQFTSVVLAKDLSAQLGTEVHVTVVVGHAPARCPAIEVFVAELPEPAVSELVDRQTGCHVALELAPGVSFDRVREMLHAHGCWEIPLMRRGALTNPELGSSVLYVDVTAGSSTRRLELIAGNSRAGR